MLSTTADLSKQLFSKLNIIRKCDVKQAAHVLGKLRDVMVIKVPNLIYNRFQRGYQY